MTRRWHKPKISWLIATIIVVAFVAFIITELSGWKWPVY